MRNLFDQYEQPENRLTHSLAISLYYDRQLLNRFVRWITKDKPNFKRLEIIQQQRAGDIEFPEEEASSKGLPDAWIFDDTGWSLIIESKVASKLKKGQLVRHFNTAISRGFDKVTILVIDTVKPKIQLPEYVVSRTWSEIYQWLMQQASESSWAKMTMEYFEVAEVKFADKKYLMEGTLTIFSGVPFGKNEPYNYLTAKRILKLAMDELRQRKDLVQELNMDPRGSGRGMITGSKGAGVWDYLSLKSAQSKENFTKYPHLTLSLEKERVTVIVTVPHRIKTQFRRNLINLGEQGFNELMETIARKLLKVLKKEKRAAPMISVAQRRYPTQSSPAIMDARIEYDMRTAFNIDSEKKLRVKQQPQWLHATYEAVSNKRSNLQFAIGAVFPYQYCAVQQSKELINYVANTWIACKPMIDVLLKEK